MSSSRSAGIWVAGVDGCSDGWIVAFASPMRRKLRIRVVRRFEQILNAPEAPVVIAVDIPIGLPSFVGSGGRGPEKAIRRLLGRRRSSVFSVPSRRAITISRDVDDIAKMHTRASIAASTSSSPPTKVSRQSLMIFPKIIEVDRLFRHNPSLTIYETHPELAFWHLNGKTPMRFPKKRGEGAEERRRILAVEPFYKEDLWAPAPRGAKTDDLLDAIVCAVVARKILRGQANSYPAPSRRDYFGLPMAIWA